jgi:glycosyltransferase involved in cell wall biosynthesis
MISVCIPTHEQSGYGEEYLRALLDSIALQRGVELEVVVSDNSRDNKLRKVCQGYAHTLGIKYVRNRRKIGISNNTNNAIAKATSDKIKIMYQDDLLVSPVALRRFEECLARKAWAVYAN